MKRISRALAAAVLLVAAGAASAPRESRAPERAVAAGVEEAVAYRGYTRLLHEKGGVFDKYGWNHYGPGGFSIDPRTGVMEGHGGMGLLWYAAKRFRDFVLECDYLCAAEETNSGIFVRIPGVPSSDDYIHHAIEVQINDAGRGSHATGAAYDIKAPEAGASLPPGRWNHMRIEFRGRHLAVAINGRTVLNWEAVAGGKVKDLAPEGYIGFQNHDSAAAIRFKDIYLKEL